MSESYRPPQHFDKYEKHGAYHWRQYEQHTKYRRHADRVVQWVDELSILDIGAGDGKITTLLRDAGKTAIGIDNEPVAVRLAQQMLAPVHLGDAYRMPYPDRFFEAALMADVLEHFERPVDVLKEARRVIRTHLYVTTPPKRPDGKLTDKFHWVEWTPEELRDLVERVGYRLVGEIDSLPDEKVMYAKFRRA